MILVPLLTLVFGVDIRYAVGASLVSVIATSVGCGGGIRSRGLHERADRHVLEIATTLGALAGAMAAAIVAPRAVAIVWRGALVLGLRFQPAPRTGRAASPIRWPFGCGWMASYPRPAGSAAYHVRRVPLGFLLMFVAGILSGLLGIGSGAVKVLAMDQAMGIPFKVSTTTSNFMIGVTAAASAGIYLGRGDVDPGLAMPVMLGVLPGAAAWRPVPDEDPRSACCDGFSTP